jgi:hypothetical protein
MYYLRYLRLFAESGVQHMLGFVCLSLVSCAPNVARFSGLSIFESSFGIL